MDKHYLKSVKEYYINEFLNSDLEFTKINLAEYPDDWNDIRYVSDNFPTSVGRYKFLIKDSWLRKSLYVRIEKLDRQSLMITLYNDFFSLKKKNKIKDKIINIINITEFNIISNIIGPCGIRTAKLKKILNKM